MPGDLPSDVLQDIRSALERIGDELRVLREVMDEIREELVWAVRNDVFRSPPSDCRCMSTPADPVPDGEIIDMEE